LKVIIHCEMLKAGSIVRWCPILALLLSSFFIYSLSRQIKYICSLLLPSMELWHQLSHDWVTIDEFWIDNLIYWTVTNRNYNVTANSHIHCCSLHHVWSLFSWLCLHQLLSGGRSNHVLCFCARVLTGWLLTHNQLIAPTVQLITSRHGLHRKHLSSVAVSIVAFTSVGMPMWSVLSHCLATAVVYRAIT
jgi:hypothetical protein